MTVLDYALQYARKGWSVFPTHGIYNGLCTCGNIDCSSPGKHPVFPGGFKHATTDEVQIAQWFTADTFANIGIATGSVSGLLVVDIDVGLGKEGEKSLQNLEKEVGTIPRETVVRTGSGGMHIYLQMPDQPIKGSTGKLGKNLDVRADGGYVIAPPSTHYSGNNYEWINTHA